MRLFRKAVALKLLKFGVGKGLISHWEGTGYPKNIWSMTEDGTTLEAQLEIPGKGAYHGYPLETNDDFREAVIAKWRKSNA